eukprot:gene22748-biopygen1205
MTRSTYTCSCFCGNMSKKLVLGIRGNWSTRLPRKLKKSSELARSKNGTFGRKAFPLDWGLLGKQGHVSGSRHSRRRGPGTPEGGACVAGRVALSPGAPAVDCCLLPPPPPPPYRVHSPRPLCSRPPLGWTPGVRGVRAWPI